MQPGQKKQQAKPRALSFGWQTLLAALTVCALFAAPTFAGSKKGENKVPAKASTLVWPPPPQKARISFVRQITGIDDVKGKSKRSWMDRAAGAKPKAAAALLQKPYGIAVDSKGRIFVADPANRAVFVFDVDGKQVQVRGDRAPAQFALPVGVAIDANDRLFVSDSHFHQVTCFDANGDVLAVFGTEELERPGVLALDPAGKFVYVPDAKRGQVAVFDAQTFRFVRYFGEKAAGEGEDGKLVSPGNVVVDAHGNAYITDTASFRVQVFDKGGKFVRAFGQNGVRPGDFRRPKGIAIDSDGHLYVADAEFNNFQILTPEGEPLLAVGGNGNSPGQFSVIAGIHIDKQNRIYVTDQWPGRVQVFQYIPDAQAAAGNPAPQVTAQK